MKILVTGGAGFIGSHLVRALYERNHSITILDNLAEQVHGTFADEVVSLKAGVQSEFVRGDVRDINMWRRCLADCDVVYHLAAEVGVGQSMYRVARYISVNTMGTANLLEVLANERHCVRKVIVASSMSIYGEGAYQCPNCGPKHVATRPDVQLIQGQWEHICERCSAVLQPMPTSETKALNPTSVYAVSKRDQEELCLAVGRAYEIPTVAFRFFNTYGPGQALSNPYTGVAAIFASRLMNNTAPLVFEDGHQSRDFVHVYDVVAGLVAALETENADYQAINLGSGQATTIVNVAQKLASDLGVTIAPQITGKYRKGDIRHCYADITKASELLGYSPTVALEDGIRDLVGWVGTQVARDGVDAATIELAERGLTT